MKILAISGSLRAKSSSTSLVEAARVVAPPGMSVTVYDGLGSLPHFNPDLDAEGSVPPPEVAELRRQIGEADALIISTPEYAHGVPGSLKNALDWLVSSLEFPGIPVGLINPSHESFHANESLREILKTMSARLPAAASVRIPLPKRGMDAAAIAADEKLAAALSAVIVALSVAGPREEWS
jgi:chromate reductase, NAD(P)H dehydrogenase (quinone)